MLYVMQKPIGDCPIAVSEYLLTSGEISWFWMDQLYYFHLI